MNREDWRAFDRWLDTASVEELHVRQGKLETLLEKLRDPDVRRDAYRMQREVEREILSRLSRP